MEHCRSIRSSGRLGRPTSEAAGDGAIVVPFAATATIIAIIMIIVRVRARVRATAMLTVIVIQIVLAILFRGGRRYDLMYL